MTKTTQRNLSAGIRATMRRLDEDMKRNEWTSAYETIVEAQEALTELSAALYDRMNSEA